MGDKDILLIQKAITLERGRYKNYKEMSERVLNIEAKEVLKELAKIEKDHAQLLEKQIKSINKFNKINLDILESNEITLSKKERRFKTISSLSGDIGIIGKAEILEREDPPFYQQLINQTTNTELKKVFQFLKKEEDKHLRALKSKLKDLQILSSKLSMAADPRLMFYGMMNE